MANEKKYKGIIGILTGGGDVPGLIRRFVRLHFALCVRVTR